MNEFPAYREPLTPTVKRVLALLVVLFHVAVGWALVTISPHRLIVGDVAAMEIRMVQADPAAQADPVIKSTAEPLLPEIAKPPELEVPREPEMPVFPPPTELATVVEPPPVDLPPPVFPIAAPPQQPPEQTREAKPAPPRPPERPKVPTPTRPAEAQPNAAPAVAAARPAPPATPKTVSASQVAYIKPPSTEYPARSRRAGEQGRVRLLVLVDIAGRPAQVNLQTSSGFAALDEAAASAVRAALFRPYSEGGVAQAVWVVVPIDFVLR